MALMKLDNVTLDFHVLESKASGKQKVVPNNAVGGQLAKGSAGYLRVRALEDVSLCLKPGDRLALLGHNGAGKSTLLRVMAKLYEPTAGEVVAEGRVAPL